MTTTKQDMYQELLTKYREYILGLKKADVDFQQQLLQEVKTLAQEEPEFRKALDETIQEYLIQVTEAKASILRDTPESLLEDLRAFTRGESIQFDEITLDYIIYLYRHNSTFREVCDTDSEVYDAFHYWYADFQRKAASDEMFKARSLLRNLRLLSLQYPITFDETELSLLDRLSSSNSDFQDMLQEEDAIVRETLVNLLEERKHHK